ncbi:MAG: hypothetical protein JWL69_2251 [Phycisphaerales bacterium]|nr:hypothetical protein [Phycisphaerales bacterium]
MCRPLFTILSAISLLLCVGTCGLWVRSYRPNRFDGIGDPPLLSDSKGEIIFACRDWVGDTDPYSRGGMGFYLNHGSENVFYENGVIAYANVTRTFVPYWAMAMLFAVLAIICLRIRSSGPRSFGEKVCFICGYDLRATPDQCPECGTVPVPKKEISN